MTPAIEDLAPGRRVGPYEIERKLGVGGMAAVYLARHTGNGAQIALKILHPHIAAMPNCVERFLQEARAASSLRHRHVIEVHDVNLDGGRPYLTMEYVPGETLAERLMRLRRIPVEALVAILLPVISAVSAAHAAGIIHRDLKPENIILTRDAEGERPVLLDFGISKILEGPVNRALTQTGTVVGTPYYMAPEQIRAEDLDARADQYALGILLYECSTGLRPFRAEQSVFVLMAEILLGQPQPPSQIEPLISPAFEGVILRAMAARREDRFSTVESLGRALLPFASPDMQRRWARPLGADPDNIAATANSAPPALLRGAAGPSSQPPSALDDSVATQPLIRRLTKSEGEPLRAADLRALSSLYDFSDTELEAFCLIASGRKFAKDGVLFAQGSVGDACFAIVRGTVEISKELGGKAFVLDELGPGTFIGQDALAERATRSVTARASEDTLVIELGRSEVQRLLGFHDQVALRLLEQIAITGIRQLRAATKKLATLLEARATGRKPDGSQVTATRPLEQLRAAVREWSVHIEEK